MALQNPTIVTIDAILTKKGRELLARGDGSFNITQFALADDEVDYTLYNPNHPSGSAFFGEAIEKLPLLEAIPDESQVMKYKLVTLPRGTSKLPVINIGYTSISLKQSASLTITPQTLNYLGSTTTYEPSGYVVTIGDIRLLSTFTGQGIDKEGIDFSTLPNIGSKLSKSDIGTTFNITATTINTLFGNGVTDKLVTTLTVLGRDSGARLNIPLVIIKN